MLPSRYPAGIVVTFPLNYVDPNLTADTGAAPDATATGDGLAIQGTKARLYSGTRDPNHRIKASMGSIFLRVGKDVEYSAYLKDADDTLDTGWFPLVTLGGKASGGGGTFTFGLTNDTVGSNSASRYGNVLQDTYITGGAVSVVGFPTTADMILDIKFTSDEGATWHSILPPGNTEAEDAAYMSSKIIFPMVTDLGVFNPIRILFTVASPSIIPAGSCLRIDTLQSGGATDINVDIQGGPKPPPDDFGGSGIVPGPIVYY